MITQKKLKEALNYDPSTGIFTWLRAHRPREEIDHINGIRTDNKWSNLREATSSENKQNMIARRNSAAGMLGVTWVARKKKWMARITVGKYCIHLGTFHDRESAHAAYMEAKEFFHKFNPTVRKENSKESTVMFVQ